MLTCAEFAKKLQWAAVRAKNELDIPTEATMKVAEEKAKEVIGTYDYGWPQLAASTLAQKKANTPLFETGELRDSVACISALSPIGAEGLVYSDDVIALYQEMGTSRGIPPRSFLYQSLLRTIPEMSEIFARFAEKIIVGE